VIIEVPIEEEAQRLDSYLARKLPQYSRAYLQRLIADGRTRIAGSSGRLKPAWRTQSGLIICLDIPAPEMSALAAEPIALDIVYEDDWLIVVNKPQGMVVHPGAGHAGGTLANALMARCQGQLSDINGRIRPGIVHRIDKDTSGLILAVKNNQAHMVIAEQIRRHAVKRTYLAVAHGRIPEDSGTIDAPIGRDPGNRQRMAVVKGGKPSVTHFRILERFTAATYLEVELESGRTHQIRVHMHYIGHPLLGDPVYASKRNRYALSGQALHASRLEFAHPDGSRLIKLESPLPGYFKDLLERLK
jgi:23S rRNA pseudouridine1911/1915/1917 synthase